MWSIRAGSSTPRARAAPTSRSISSLGDPPREGPPGHGLSINPAILDPKSRGTVRLRSTNPQDPILFDPKFLTAPEDVSAFVRGIKLARKISEQPAVKKL